MDDEVDVVREEPRGRSSSIAMSYSLNVLTSDVASFFWQTKNNA
jgi:hypothetical protein